MTEAWRDIYVLGTNINAWQRLIDELRKSDYDLTYFRNGQTVLLPEDAKDPFPLEGKCDRLLFVCFGGVLAYCHFFTSDEIEFDIDPREVVGQPQLDRLFDFMRCLAESVGQDAILCPGSCSDIVIFRIRDGAAPVEYQAFGGWHV